MTIRRFSRSATTCDVQHAVRHRNNERGTFARALSDSSSAQTCAVVSVRAAAGGSGRTEQLVGCAVRPCDLQSLRQPRRRVVRSTVRETRGVFRNLVARTCHVPLRRGCHVPRRRACHVDRAGLSVMMSSECGIRKSTSSTELVPAAPHIATNTPCKIRSVHSSAQLLSVPSRPVPSHPYVRACTFMCGCMCCMRGHSVRGGVCARAPASGLTRARACANTYAYVVSASAPAAFRALLARRAAVAGCAVSSRRCTVALPTLQSALTRADTP